MRGFYIRFLLFIRLYLSLLFRQASQFVDSLHSATTMIALCTHRHRDSAGFESPEKVYQLLVDAPSTVTLTTCPISGVHPRPFANYDAVLRLYDGNPALAPEPSLLAENESGMRFFFY